MKKPIAAGDNRLVIAASSVGALFEWYDFFLYGALAIYIAQHFFSGVNETTGFILALAAFAVGFIVRPVGALVFGRIGDIVGRKNTFLVTMGVMGVATFAVGLLPGDDALGVAAPIILVLLRMLQGLAIGGEYGGAAIYVGEHASDARRGAETGWIQTTAALGLLLALAVIMATRAVMDPDDFAQWGWRIPFLISIVLLGISLWIRLKLNESPVFAAMKARGETSSKPWREAFGDPANVRRILAVLFGCVAGQAVCFYTTTFYALYFLERVLKVDGLSANIMLSIALAIGAPFYVVFGALSDRIGRKRVILAGLAAGVILFYPLFKGLTYAANPAFAEASARSTPVVYADPAACALQFDPVGRARFDERSCDIVKSTLARAGVGYSTRPLAAGAVATVEIGGSSIVAPEPARLAPEARTDAVAAFRAELQDSLAVAGYPPSADPARINRPLTVAILTLLVIINTITYGPLAAYLVELFPARVRYTSLSAPYHFGNGWFGGLMPTTAFAIIAGTGAIYSGLIYPIAIALMSLVIGVIFLPETRRA